MVKYNIPPMYNMVVVKIKIIINSIIDVIAHDMFSDDRFSPMTRITCNQYLIINVINLSYMNQQSQIKGARK